MKVQHPQQPGREAAMAPACITCLLASDSASALSESQPSDRVARRVLVTGVAIDDCFGEIAREPSSTITLSGRKLVAKHAESLIPGPKTKLCVTLDTSGGDELKIEGQRRLVKFKT